MTFYMLIKIEAEDIKEAKQLREYLAGSNDGSEAIANAQLLAEDDLRKRFTIA